MCGIRNWIAGGMVFVSSIALATSSDMGAGSSGGGDNLMDDAGVAWFARPDRTIEACIELSPDFGVSKKMAKAEIENAFGTWQQYIDGKFKYADIKLGLATKIAVADQCTGAEDLTFYFGTMSEEVRIARSQYTNPTAFAFKRSYHAENLWGQGWIWIAPQASVFPKENFPDWAPKEPINVNGEKQPYALRAMLLHEVGHVLGNPHVAGTVMTEHISELLRAGAHLSEVARIDHARELAVCWECGYEWNGWLSINGADPYANTDSKRVIRENFEILTGHAPKTDWIGATIRRTVRPDMTGETVLEVSDLSEKYSFPIQFPSDPLGAINYTRVEDSTPIFKRMLQAKPTPGFRFEKVQGMVLYGSLATLDGKQIPIILERNLPAGDVPNFNADFRLKMIVQGQLRPLFEASWLQLVGTSQGDVQPILRPEPQASK